jgi:hypothetical protein
MDAEEERITPARTGNRIPVLTKKGWMDKLWDKNYNQLH